MSKRRRILKPLLSLSVLGVAVLIVSATLSGRPSIRQPEGFRQVRSDESFLQTLTHVNEQLAETALREVKELAPRADNLTIARRIALGLVGSGLSLEEIRALEQVPESEQIDWWTTYLLQDQRWADYFAERFSRAFVGTNNGPFLLFRRRKFNAWLAEQFSEDVGYDEIVRKMIASEGLWTDTPQVNFVTATMEDGDNGRANPIRLAGRTSRAFLAQRIDCLQCHDDFLGNLNFGDAENPSGGVQQNFHELAAFYSGTAFPGAPFQGIGEDNRKYEYKYLGESEEEAVEPRVPFAAELLPQDGKPRTRLANWVTHPENKAFARAAVNRVWALLFSQPLVAPVDSIPLDDSVPEVMDTLAQDFVNHDFKLQRLIRLIIATDAFQRSSRTDFEVTDAHEAAWAVFPVSQLRPEQVSGSVFQASRLTAIDATSSIVTRLQKFGQTQDFLKRFGDRGEDEFDSHAVTITQRLVLMNGNLVADKTKIDLVNNASTRISQFVEDDAQAVELIFLSVLNRMPSENESASFVEHLCEHKGNARTRAVNDIYWAMLNSTEFSWNH